MTTTTGCSLCWSLISLALAAWGPLEAAEPVSVIPRPEKMELREGVFTFGPATTLVAGPGARGTWPDC